jgi:uncharacterized membrane protein YphA (DoxX/SURF4 family)
MKKTIIYIITLLFSALFLYAGVTKLADLDLFRSQLELSPVLSPIAGFISIALPIAEILLAILLLVPDISKITLLCTTIVMSSFTLYVLSLLLFDPHLPCSCGGLLEELSWKEHLVLNVSLVIISLWGYFLTSGFNLRGGHFLIFMSRQNVHND